MSETFRTTIEEAGQSSKALDMSFFMTARRDLTGAVQTLGLSSEQGFDEFDEYTESFGRTEGAAEADSFCLFSYRPQYKRTFSVATARDPAARSKVYRFLVENLDLKPSEIIFTNENGYDIRLQADV